jgi:hypothetical protein
MIAGNLERGVGKKSARIIGVLFIISTVAGVLSLAAFGSILDEPVSLEKIASNRSQVLVGALLELICAGAFLGIAVVIFSTLKAYSERFAIGYVVARSFEALPFIIGIIGTISLVILSHDYVQTGLTDATYLPSLGAFMILVHQVTNLVGSMILFSITALILNYALLRSRVVPRFISIWGLIGAPMMLVAGVLGVFGLSFTSTISLVLTMPLALNEMVFAVWLIIKGFAHESGSNRVS